MEASPRGSQVEILIRFWHSAHRNRCSNTSRGVILLSHSQGVWTCRLQETKRSQGISLSEHPDSTLALPSVPDDFPLQIVNTNKAITLVKFALQAAVDHQKGNGPRPDLETDDLSAITALSTDSAPELPLRDPSSTPSNQRQVAVLNRNTSSVPPASG